MTTVLSFKAMQELDWYLVLFVDVDSKIEKEPFPTYEYGGYGTDCDHELLGAGMVATNPENAGRRYITQAGADYLNAAIKIITPFDGSDTPTPPNAEIEWAAKHPAITALRNLIIEELDRLHAPPALYNLKRMLK